MAPAGIGDLLDHVALAALPGGGTDVVRGGFGRPQAEAADMLADQQNLPGTPGLGGGTELVGIEFLGIDLGEIGLAIGIIFRPFPGGDPDAGKQGPFLFVPGILVGRWPGQLGRRRIIGHRRIQGGRCRQRGEPNSRQQRGSQNEHRFFHGFPVPVFLTANERE